MNDKNAIAARIKALLQMTTANGCTEAEAMAAAEKARELMDKYQIDLTEEELKAEGIDISATSRGAMGHIYIADYLFMTVAQYCDCKGWRTKKQSSIEFMGLRSDAEFATWLLNSLTAFVRRSTASYTFTLRGYTKKQRWMAQRSFAQGCIERINVRLEALIAERKNRSASDGRSLIVVKNELVDAAFSAIASRFKTTGGRGKVKVYEHSWAQGQSAGDRASFGKPVNGGAAVRMIGRD